MNFQSGKFRTFILGKLVALARVIVRKLKIGYVINSKLSELSKLKICCVKTSPIGDCGWCGYDLARGKAGN